MPLSAEVGIPPSITVHLGERDDSSVGNVTVPFPDYIKNVASSEIFPSWPDSALRANIYAQISFALNRVYTEYYRSRGYPFDITNSTVNDQSFVPGRNIFENISNIVDEIFNSYVVRQGSIEPFFAQYCNGTTVTCDGLSQWGSVTLAEQGLGPYEILQYYYGDDIDIRMNVPVRTFAPSAPSAPLTVGSVGNDVGDVQLRLNRISQNYPAIPKIYPTDGIFGPETMEAVRAFQNIFNMPNTGQVDSATWYRIEYIYASVKRLNELNSEGLTLSEIGSQFPDILRFGDTGDYVRILQYFLAFVGTYVAQLPPIAIDGVFGEETRDAVFAFQNYYGLPADGIVGEQTWNRLYDVYRGIYQSLPQSSFAGIPVPFGGRLLQRGTSGADVELLQEYLNTLSGVYREIPAVPRTGVFDLATYEAVIVFEELFGFEPNGIIGPLSWDTLAEEATAAENGQLRSTGQYPGSASMNGGDTNGV